MKIKVLSIRQPWAWAIVNGWKPVENREWPSRYRGELYIHAGKKEETEDLDEVLQLIYETTVLSKHARPKSYVLPMASTYRATRGELGCIVGRVSMIDCVTEHPSPWFCGDYGFVFEKPELVKPIPLSGRLGIFETSVDGRPE